MSPYGRLLLACLMAAAAAIAAEDRPEQTVGTLDFFGLRRLNQADVRAKLALAEGDNFARDNIRGLVAKLEKIPGVEKATIAPITVDGSGRLKVFVGIKEEGSHGFAFREPPTGTQRLPEELAQIYRDFGASLGPAVRKGGNSEDHSQGHALNKDPDMRKTQEAAIAAMKENEPVVREVLKSSGNADDRRAAAWLLGYAADKKAVVVDLADAARDPDATVRNNATRGLGAIADLAAKQPDLGIAIDPAVFIDMLGSVTWSDLNKASFLLEGMTRRRPPDLLQTLRARALPELADIARWKSEGHAFPAIRILGRIAGWSDDETMRVRRDEGVEKIIAAALGR